MRAPVFIWDHASRCTTHTCAMTGRSGPGRNTSRSPRWGSGAPLTAVLVDRHPLRRRPEPAHHRRPQLRLGGRHPHQLPAAPVGLGPASGKGGAPDCAKAPPRGPALTLNCLCCIRSHGAELADRDSRVRVGSLGAGKLIGTTEAGAVDVWAGVRGVAASGAAAALSSSTMSARRGRGGWGKPGCRGR